MKFVENDDLVLARVSPPSLAQNPSPLIRYAKPSISNYMVTIQVFRITGLYWITGSYWIIS